MRSSAKKSESAIVTTDTPVPDDEAISGSSRSASSIGTVTSASTRPGSAPGKGVTMVANRLVIVGSSCRPMVRRVVAPSETMTRTAKTKRRALR